MGIWWSWKTVMMVDVCRNEGVKGWWIPNSTFASLKKHIPLLWTLKTLGRTCTAQNSSMLGHLSSYFYFSFPLFLLLSLFFEWSTQVSFGNIDGGSNKGIFGPLLDNKRASNELRKIFGAHSQYRSRTIMGCV
jgi:hypothetical protein